MPTPTDLVTDLPADFEVFGQAVDSTMADLKGGTSGQILSKNSNTDMDFVWITNDQGDITGVTAGTGISGGGTSGTVTITNSMATEITAKGDLIVGTGSATFDNLAAGANGSTLVADSSTSTGLKWAKQGFQFIKRASFNNVATTTTSFDGIFTSAYETYLVVIESILAITGSDDLQMQFRAGGVTLATTYYGQAFGAAYNVTSLTFNTINGANQATLGDDIGNASYPSAATITLNRVGNGSRKPVYYGNGIQGTSDLGTTTFAGTNDTAGVYDGLLFKSSSSNITGTIAVYGLATA